MLFSVFLFHYVIFCFPNYNVTKKMKLKVLESLATRQTEIKKKICGTVTNRLRKQYCIVKIKLIQDTGFTMMKSQSKVVM